MGLTRVAITRPVFILMVISAMVILGLVSFSRLNAELYPPIATPVVSVITTYAGAGPEDVERLISKPIEDAVAGIADIDFVSSSSTEGRSVVTITFTDKAEINIAASDVERRVSAIRAQLPSDADAPSVLKLDFGALPVLYLAVTGDLPMDQLFQLAKDEIKPRLETRNGVGQVELAGGLEREIQVQVNMPRLRAYDLTIDHVQAALQRENQGVPGGSIERGGSQQNLRLYGLFQSPVDLRELTVASTPQGVVRLRDIAQVVDTNKRIVSRTYLNGREAVGVTVTKQSGANEIATVNAVRAEINRLNRELPSGAQIAVISDTSVFTRNSLTGVQRSLVEAVALTGLVLLVFLHTFRSTTIVLFAIPTSVISTFLVMNVFGFTLNIMSTMGLVLVIGVLVDDSIVVIENIYRHLELGETPWSAALKGRSEIGLAAIAITLVDVVVFTPVAFMSGISGSFFRQFGLVIASATLLSLFVSFTLTPMLASRWLQSGKQIPVLGLWRWFTERFEALIEGLRWSYEKALGWALRHRWLPPLVGLFSLVLAFMMVPAGFIKFEFIPQSDNGLFLMNVELPPGSSLEATERILRETERRLGQVPEVEYYLSTSGVGANVGSAGGGSRNARFGRIMVVLVDKHHRQRALAQVIEQVTADAETIPGAMVRVQTSSGGGSGQPVQVRVTGDDPRQLQALGRRVEQIIATTPGARDVTNSASEGSPEVRLIPDRRLMADLGITTQQMALALRTAVEGIVATKLRPEGQPEVDIRLIADDTSRADWRDVGNIPLGAQRQGWAMVALGQVARVEQVAGPASIDRRNRERLISLGANLAPGVPLNDVTGPVQRAIAQLRAEGAIPNGYDVRLGGQAEDQAEAFGNIGLALGLSIILEYMLLAALYESMILPFATMFALPVAIVGAFLGLAVSGNTLNLLSLIGVIVLMGLVGKNGILLVDLTNQLRQQGLSRTDALRRAGPTRLRPILMTTMALVFGLMPLALKIEEGSEIYAGMAAVIIGGMLSSTLLSLLVVPCMYTYFDDLQAFIGRVWRWRPFRSRRRPAPSIPAAEQVDTPAPRHLEEVGAGAPSPPG